MKWFSFGYGGIALATVALLAGCAGASQSGGEIGLTPLSIQRGAAMTMPHYIARPVHADRSRSWMLRPKKHGKSGLIYAGDWSTNDVYVYDYSNGKQVGELTGFDEPYGMCVDAKGDIYISNFGNGTLVEYAHGGTTPLNTYNPGGEPIGCSVDSKGDVAATSFAPGGVTVYPGGDSGKGATYSDADCEYQWTMGYDDRGNLIGVGEYNSITACALLAGSKSETTLTTSGITIDFPGGTMWDGKYIGLGDQEAGGTYVTGVWPSTLSGTTLSSSVEAKFPGCNSNYTDDINPFIVGKKNTPVNREQGKVMVGYESCASGEFIAFWHYPQGGNPYKTYSITSAEPYGLGVSLGT